MKRLLSKFIWFAVVISGLNIQGVLSVANAMDTDIESSKQEVTFFVSIHELFFDQDEIAICLDGDFFIVSSLKRAENNWLATVDLGLNYCPQGHPMCGLCTLCHLVGCRYYVEPCWKR